MNPVEPDEHLRAALRHAPDADLSAPPQLGARILAEARRSAAEAPVDPASHGAASPPAQRQPWRARWRLQHWGASGALATLLMAGFIALLWRGEVPAPASETPPVAAPPLGSASDAEPAIAPSTRTADEAAAKPAAAFAERRSGSELAARRSAAAPAATGAPAAPDTPALPPWREPPRAGDVLGWQPSGDLIAPDAAWLARLARSTQGRWQPVHRATGKPMPTAELPLLQWQRAGRTLGYLWFGASDVTWCGATTACEQAPLPDAARHQLLAPLTR